MPNGPTVIGQPPPALPLHGFAPPRRTGGSERRRWSPPKVRRTDLRVPPRPCGGPAGAEAARRRSCGRIRATRGEEIRQQLTALVGEHPALRRRVVVEARLREEVDDRTARPGLRVAGAVDESP